MFLCFPDWDRDPEQFKALKGVSLEIGTGMFGLLGPNGAGKSTMIRIICGILEQSYGKIWINGIDTQEKREELQGLIGYLPQEFGMYENMSAYAYLDYQAILKGITDQHDQGKTNQGGTGFGAYVGPATEKDRGLFGRNEAADRYCPGAAAPAQNPGGG